MVQKSISVPVGIVVRRRPGATRWAKWSWKAVAALPGAAHADWQEMRREGDAVEYHAATLPLTLYRSDTEAYRAELSSEAPSLYVIMRDEPSGEDTPPLTVLLVTASPYEGQDYEDSGEDLVERVPMPEAVFSLIYDFVAEHHTEEVFVKRRRDTERVDRVEDGKGDARISQVSDVYRAPRRREGEMLH